MKDDFAAADRVEFQVTGDTRAALEELADRAMRRLAGESAFRFTLQIAPIAQGYAEPVPCLWAADVVGEIRADRAVVG